MFMKPRLAVGLVAVCVFLVNVYLDHILLIWTTGKLSLSDVSGVFVLRHSLSLGVAYPIGRWGRISNIGFVALFIAPNLLLFHGLYISQANGMLELWPPFLFLDLVLFLPALILHILGRRQKSKLSS